MRPPKWKRRVNRESLESLERVGRAHVLRPTGSKQVADSNEINYICMQYRRQRLGNSSHLLVSSSMVSLTADVVHELAE